jgi:hypothetical protein
LKGKLNSSNVHVVDMNGCVEERKILVYLLFALIVIAHIGIGQRREGKN